MKALDPESSSGRHVFLTPEAYTTQAERGCSE